MTEQDHRIHNPELAHHMGYAEKPLHDIADMALAAGSQEVHDEALRKADAAGVLAGKEYIVTLHESLNYFDTDDGQSDNIEGNERFKNIFVGPQEFEIFEARSLAENPNSPHARMAARSCNRLTRLEHHLDPNSDYHQHFGPPMVRTAPVYDRPATNSAGHVLARRLDFGSLVSIMDEYRSLQAQMGEKPSKILGDGFTERVVDFLTDFVQYKKSEIENS